MSLAEAILDLAVHMEATVTDLNKGGEYAERIFAGRLTLYASQLRLLVKASEGNPSVPPAHPFPEVQVIRTRDEVRRDQVRQELKRLAQAEEGTERMVLVAEGPMMDVYVTISPDMPVGAKTYLVDKQVYQLREDQKLYHCPDKGKLSQVLDPRD